MTRWLAACLLLSCGDERVEPPPPFDPATCEPFSHADDREDERIGCTYQQGDDTATSLGIERAAARRIPITHVIIRMQENRSFDHFLGNLPRRGHPEVDGFPETFSNVDLEGNEVPVFHLESTCLEADPPHQWEPMVVQWNDGELDGFIRSAAVEGSNGHYVMGYYDEEDLPFYYWLARTYAISDRYFSSSLGGTWSNRNFLYTGSAHTVKNTFDRILDDVPTLFDQLTAARVRWGVYTDGPPRQDTLGWGPDHEGVHPYRDLLDGLADGTLPNVTFVDTLPWGPVDEHPPNDVQGGEGMTREIYEAARQSPLWSRLALILNYDTAGGLFEHVPPPEACVPGPDNEDFTQYGLRVPFFIVSPWSKPGYVSHTLHSHTSVVRFVQLLFDLPALTNRDANSDALLDMLELDCDPDFLEAPAAPPSGAGGCP